MLIFLFILRVYSQVSHYAFWWQYLPFSNIQKQGNLILNSQTTYTGQLIMTSSNLINGLQSNQIMIWLTFDLTNINISVYDNGSIKNFTQNPLQFEGIWFLTYFEQYQSGTRLYIKGITTNQIVLINSLQTSPILFQYGDVSNFNFDYFHGQYSDIYYIVMNNFIDIQNFNNYVNSNLFYPQENGEVNLQIFSNALTIGDTFYTTTFQLTGYKYQMRCWIKVSYANVLTRQRYLLLRMTLNQNYRNDTYLGDRLLLMSYVLDPSTDNYNLFNVSLLTYTYPYPMAWKTLAPQIYTIQNTSNFQRFQQWHYIYFQFSDANTLLTVWFPNNQQISTTFNVIQFHNQYVYLYVGADTFFYKGFLAGQMTLEFNYNYVIDKSYSILCHYSCKNCIGPTESDCIDCPDNSNRIFSHGYCYCTYGYIDSGQNCQQLQYQYSNLIQIYDKSNTQCKYGEFQINNNCQKCPSIITDYQISCIDCLLNYQYWVSNPICTIDYKRWNLTQTYMKITRNLTQYEIFSINSTTLEINLCIGCQSYCNDQTKSSCILFKNNYYTCKEGYYLQDNQCLQCMKNCVSCINSFSCITCINYYGFNGSQCIQCPFNCKTCNSTNQCLSCQSRSTLYNGKCYKCGARCLICEYYYNGITKAFINRCLKCTDPQLYEISYDALKCQPVYIANCTYGISIYGNSWLLNNFDLYFQPQTISTNVYSYCARCISTYSYNFQTAKCYKSTNVCDESGMYTSSYFCLIGGENALQSRGCASKLANCYECLNYLNKVICMTCETGYYGDHIIGACIKCPTNCLTCEQQFTKNQGLWKKDIRAFYEYLINANLDHDFLTYAESFQPTDFTIVCTSCNDGYEVDSNYVCIQKCPSDCLYCIKLNGENICSQCNYNYNGLILSTNQQSCQKCHGQCKFCIFFNDIDDPSPYQSQCILPISDNLTYDQQIYQFSNCTDASNCVQTMSININLSCDQTNNLNSNTILYQQEQDLSFIFQQYYNSQLYTYMNEQNIQVLNIYLNIISKQCTFPQNLVIEQQFSQNIQTLTNVTLQILCQENYAILQFLGNIYFNSFNSIWIQNAQINLPNQIIDFHYSTDSVILGFLNVIFYSNNHFTFQYTYLSKFYLINTTFDTVNIQSLNSLFLTNQTNSEEILLFNLTFINCIFIDTILFQFPITNNLIIENIIFNLTTITNSTIFLFKQQGLIDNLIIINNVIQKQSTIFSGSVMLKNINILQSSITENSIILNGSLLNIINILFGSCSLIDYSYFLYIYLDSTQLTHNLSDCFFDTPYLYNGSQLLSIQTNGDIQLQNISYVGYGDFEYNIFAIQIQSSTLIIVNFIISFYDQINSIFLFDSITTINFQNIEINQKSLTKGISDSFSCVYDKFDTKNPLIQILNSQVITFTNVSITNIFVLNQPVILISITQSLICNVNIINSQFQNISTTKNVNNVTVSQLVFESKNQITIFFKYVIFENNVYLEYQSGSIQGSSSGLIFFSIPLGSLSIYNSQFLKNIVLNSPNSNIYIYANQIDIKNCIFQDHNTFNSLFFSTLFTQYTNILYMEQLNYDFQISSIGGIAFLQLEALSIINSTFITYKAQKAGAFYIVPLNNGVINITNSTFSNGYTVNGQTQSQGGTFYIESKNSQLNLFLQNCIITNSYSFNFGGFMYIILSQKSIIQFKNISFYDCHSLTTSILYIEISGSLQKQYQLYFEDCIITNSQYGLDHYLNYLSVNNLIYQFNFELYDSVLFTINQGIIQFQSSYFYQVIGYGIGIFKSISSLSLDNCIIQDFKLSSNPLFSIDQAIKNIQIIQSQFFNISEGYITQICLETTSITIPSKECSTYESIINYQNLQLYSLQCSYQLELSQNNDNFQFIDISYLSGIFYIDQNVFDSLINTKGAIISLTTYNKALIRDLLFINGYSSTTVFQIESLNTIYSRILSQYEYDLNSIIGKIILQNCQFLNNTSYLGGAVMFMNTNTSIYNSYFFNNTAYIGGSIYLNQSQLEITECNFINNSASIGGAIYSDLELYIDENRKNSLSNGIGKSTMDDTIQSKPITVLLSIDQLTYFTNLIKVQNSTYLEEEVNVEIGLPSGIQINNYEILNTDITHKGGINELQYDSETYEYEQLNYNFRLVPFNQYQERQYNLTNSICQIQSKLNNETNYTTDYLSYSTIIFNTTTLDYNLDNLIIFTSQNLTLQIKCNSIQIPINENNHIIGYHNNYVLLIKVTIFPCQRGELLQNNMCIQCSSDSYSLTQNSNKCVQINQDFMEAVSPSNIKIKLFYWRPYYSSDSIAYCIRQPSKCLGGWAAGADSCEIGSFGALCERCDIYDIRGNGNYFKSSSYCYQCQNNNLGYFSLLIVGLWTILSLIATVNSAVDELQLQLLRQKLIQGGLRAYGEEDQSSVLYKMLFHYLQIIQVLTTMQLSFPNIINIAVESVGSPTRSLENSLDCLLIHLDLDILHSRVIWILIAPTLYLIIIFIMYSIILLIKRQLYKKSVTSIILISTFIAMQPSMVGTLISVISFRTISNFQWVLGDVSYRFDINFKDSAKVAFPSLLILAILIPLFMYIKLKSKKRILNQSRQQWGYLYSGYREQAYYWELVRLGMKNLVMISITFFDQYIIFKATIVYLIIYIYEYFMEKHRPYKTQKLNKLDSLCSQVLQISIILGAGSYYMLQTDLQNYVYLFYVVILEINLSFMYQILSVICKEYYQKNKILIVKLKNAIRKKFPILERVPFCRVVIFKPKKTKIQERFQLLIKHLKQEAKSNICNKKGDNILGVKMTDTIQINSDYLSRNRFKGSVNVSGSLSLFGDIPLKEDMICSKVQTERPFGI